MTHDTVTAEVDNFCIGVGFRSFLDILFDFNDLIVFLEIGLCFFMLFGLPLVNVLLSLFNGFERRTDQIKVTPGVHVEHAVLTGENQVVLILDRAGFR